MDHPRQSRFAGLLLALLRLLAGLPLPLLQWVGRLAGRIVYALPGKYRERLRANARQAGYGDPAFARRAAAETGAMIMEMPKVWLRSERALAMVSTDDAALLEETRAEGRGIVYLTPHLGCFEITARFLARGEPLTVMYRPPRMAALEPAMLAGRSMPGLKTVPADMQGVREFVRALKRGESIGMLPDQAPAKGEGTWVPFFGRPAYTMTLAGKLASLRGAPVVLIAAERLSGGRGWRMHVLRLPEPLPADAQAQARLINEAMETLIRRFPEQYLWSYNRYKVPKGAAGPDPRS